MLNLHQAIVAMANNSESVFALPGSNLENFNERATAKHSARLDCMYHVCGYYIPECGVSVVFHLSRLSRARTGESEWAPHFCVCHLPCSGADRTKAER